MTQIDIKKYPNLRLGKKSSENNELLTELIEKYNTHDTGKAELISGSGAPASLLPENVIYKDTDTGDLYIGNGIKNIRHISSEYRNQNIKVLSGTIPAIPADSRQVIQVTLGELINPTCVTVGFFKSTANSAEISIPGFKDLLATRQGGTGGTFPPSFNILNTFIPPFTEDGFISNFFRVFEDYTKAMTAYAQHEFTMYGASGASMPVAYIYEELGVGVLLGYYVNGEGVFMLDKKIELESLWLTQSGSDTILNFALYNRDVAANTSKDFKVAVYE